MTTLKRIFIALNLPHAIKQELLSLREQLHDLPARWTTVENLHVSLAFLGNKSEQELAQISTILQDVGKTQAPISLSFTNTMYGPSPKNPRMIWAVLKPTQELLALQGTIEKNLALANFFEAEHALFFPHVTLARLKDTEFRRMEEEERPTIEIPLSLYCNISSIDLMESMQGRGVAEYKSLASIQLTKTL
ncbi:MAG: RNA 2',3'-cyclic phosphodiesterase [bacterium]|nr:RNA 2',3'-cyclic phosphodiesterase [bacterium]